MKVPILMIIIYVAILVVVAVFAIQGDLETEHTPTPTVTATPTAYKSQCEIDRDAIQVAFDAYHDAYGNWPTSDGQPGDIEWDKLVPEFMDAAVSKCDWHVNSNPEGEVCLPKTC
ncbi:MAG: hypothetical protein U9N44_00980 [Chloroflexota bacterium]|nr:hypothetical protein [Chloroflexota bacterium]